MTPQFRMHRVAMAAAFACAVSASWTAASGQTLVTPVMQAQAKALAKVCETDFRQHCPGVQPGGGRILACLQKNADQLSQACRDGLAQARQSGK